jgi:hypothetical protein
MLRRHFDLGVYDQTGSRNLAVEMCKKALDIQPDYQDARFLHRVGYNCGS